MLCLLLTACSATAQSDPGPSLAPGAGEPGTTSDQTTPNAPPSTLATTTIPATTPPEDSSTTTTVTTTVAATLDRSDGATADRLIGDLAAHFLDTPRTGGTAAEAATVGAIVASVESITGHRPTIEPVLLPTGAMSANVWGGTVGAGPVTLLLGAHIDSYNGSPGVDDNGSGSVLLLELLRRLTETPPEGITVSFVWFGSEEVLPGLSIDDHHFGSRQAAQRLADEGELPDWMVSVDMVGIGGRLLGVALEGADAAMARALVSAGSDVGVEVAALSRGDISDHEAFARVGVPAAMMWRPDNSAWHTADDKAIDAQLLLEDLAVLEALIAALAARPGD